MATRGGIMCVRPRPDGNVAVEFSQPRVLADRPVVTAAPASRASGRTIAALLVPNPHVVVEVSADELDALDLSAPPVVEPPLPDGQNVEFVTRLGERHLRMRVHERGSGETRSCGTGIVATAVAVASDDGVGPDGRAWRVDVPGGTCTVEWTPDAVTLVGPAVIVAELELDEAWWRDASR